MSAEFESGFSVRESMWHGQGTVLAEYPESWSAAREASGLTWDAIERPVYTRTMVMTGEAVPEGTIVLSDDGTFQDVLVPDTAHKGIARSDTGAILAVQNQAWPLITTDEMGSIAEGIVDEDKVIQYETMGSLRGGKDIWALLRFNEPIEVKGDDTVVVPYLALMNSFDVGSLKALLTMVRIVCKNTWQMADTSEFQVNIRHFGDVTERIEAAKLMIANARSGAHQYAIAANELAAINVDDALVRTFLDGFIPIPENSSETHRAQRAERQGLFMSLYNDSLTTDGVRGTAYGLMQTMGEYLDHLRPYRNQDTYLARTMLRPEPVKAQAMKAICKLVDRKDLLVLANGHSAA